MDIKDLRFFVAVYETHGFTSASEQLGTVQSNVSARIADLEDYLGVPLFERQYRKIVPTPQADRLYEHAKEVISSFGRTKQLFVQPAG